ncbi:MULTISPECIES: transaldolase family protein [unclassified Streptomyces]|uniref:transaldolase family protein n=1 Tax=unclassified Streptomyces TaxID=2593676 RepID=UPI0038269501
MNEFDAMDRRRFARQLTAEGVALWAAGLDRGALADGTFAGLVAEGLAVGATIDATALARAAAHPDSPYREQLDQLAHRGVTGDAALAALRAYDARWACDVLADVFKSSEGRDGLVSVDLPEADGRAAQELRRAVARPGLLVRVNAGTRAGITLIEECLATGVGVQAAGVTSEDRYRQVLDAWIHGLHRASAEGLDLAGLASVASVPVGRFERAGHHEAAQALARRLYRIYEERLGEEDWAAPARLGAQPQRLMWTELTEPEQVARYVGWNTVSAPGLAVLRTRTWDAPLAGDTLGGQYSARNTAQARAAAPAFDAYLVARDAEALRAAPEPDGPEDVSGT